MFFFMLLGITINFPIEVRALPQEHPLPRDLTHEAKANCYCSDGSQCHGPTSCSCTSGTCISDSSSCIIPDLVEWVSSQCPDGSWCDGMHVDCDEETGACSAFNDCGDQPSTTNLDVPDCLEDGITYFGDNIVEGRDNQQETIQGCQESCASHPQCVQWTWGKPWGHYSYWCFLRYSKGGEFERIPDMVTGDKYCNTDGYIDGGEPDPIITHLIVDSQINDENINFIKGNYWRNEQMQEGFLVYQHKRGIPFIFVNHIGQWVIGNNTSENGDYAANDQKPTPPTPPQKGWHIYYKGVWQYDDTFEAFNPDGGEPHPDHDSDYIDMSGGVGLDTGDNVAALDIMKTDIVPRIPLANRGHGGWDYQQGKKH